MPAFGCEVECALASAGGAWRGVGVVGEEERDAAGVAEGGGGDEGGVLPLVLCVEVDVTA